MPTYISCFTTNISNLQNRNIFASWDTIADWKQLSQALSCVIIVVTIIGLAFQLFQPSSSTLLWFSWFILHCNKMALATQPHILLQFQRLGKKRWRLGQKKLAFFIAEIRIFSIKHPENNFFHFIPQNSTSDYACIQQIQGSTQSELLAKSDMHHHLTEYFVTQNKVKFS